MDNLGCAFGNDTAILFLGIPKAQGPVTPPTWIYQIDCCTKVPLNAQ